MKPPELRPPLASRCLAEVIGTFGLILAGTGAIVINHASHGALGHVGVALTWGLIVLVMIEAFGHVSGAHLNPAVTLGLAAGRRFPLPDVLPYLGSQAVGAFAASGLLRVLYPADPTLGATLPAGTWWQSFVLEFFLTWLLLLVVLGVSSGGRVKGITAAFTLGSLIGLEAMFAGPASGASMNPIRSLAPAVVSGRLAEVWIYLVAPIAGALLALPVHACLHPRSHSTPPSTP